MSSTQEVSISSFRKDNEGVWHFINNHNEMPTLREAAQAAVNQKPCRDSVVFWYDGTLAILSDGDTVESLMEKWTRWHQSIGKDACDEVFKRLFPGILGPAVQD